MSWKHCAETPAAICISVVGVVDESDSSDEVSENYQNSILSPQVREPGRGRTHRRVDYSKHIETSRSRLGPSGMSTARLDIAFVNEGDGRMQRGASFSANTSLVQYRICDRDSRLNPDECQMDSSRLGRAERVFSKGKPRRTRKSGLAYDEYGEGDLRYPETITVQDNGTPTDNFRRPADNRLPAVADGRYTAEVSPADNNRRPAESVRRPADYLTRQQMSLKELHLEVRRLVKKAIPDCRSRSTEIYARDAFLTALDDVELRR